MCLAEGIMGECVCSDGGADGAQVGPSGAGGSSAGTSGPVSSGVAGEAGGGAGAVGGMGVPLSDGGAPLADAGGGVVDAGIDAGGVSDAGPPLLFVPGAFSPCLSNGDCQGDLRCSSDNSGSGSNGNSSVGYCTQACVTQTDCTAQPSTGTVKATCFLTQCVLQCSVGVQCPDGMSCLVVPLPPFTGFCTY